MKLIKLLHHANLSQEQNMFFFSFCKWSFPFKGTARKSRKETTQKLTQLSSRSHPKHLVGKRTAQKDITIDTTSDSQVNSNFSNRWSPASLTFNNYFYLFLYLYITWITTNNNAPHLKLPKNQNRTAALGVIIHYIKNQWTNTQTQVIDQKWCRGTHGRTNEFTVMWLLISGIDGYATFLKWQSLKIPFFSET